MAKKIEYNKDRVWAKIEADQKKKRRRKIIPLFFIFGLSVVAGAFLLLTWNHEKSESTVTISETGNASTITSEALISNHSNDKPILNKVEKSTEPTEKIITTELKTVNLQKSNKAKTQLPLSTRMSDAIYQHQTNTSLLPSQSSSLTTFHNHSPSATNTATKQIEHTLNIHLLPLSTIAAHSPSPLITGITLRTPFLPSSPERTICKPRQTILKQKGLFFQNAFFPTGNTSGGVQDVRSEWDNSQSYNFASTSSVGVELTFSNNLFFRTGLDVSVISATYRHQIVTVEESVSENDTLVVYNNFVETGDRKATTTTTRTLVKNNEIYRFGIPLALGYSLQTKMVDIRLLYQARLNLIQRFSGIMNDGNNMSIFNTAEQRPYFHKGMTIDHSSSILLGKNIKGQWDLNVGLSFVFNSKNRTSGMDINTHGLGLVTGVTYNLK